MDNLSNRIKWFRENLKDKDSKWTQKYVADKIGVARVTYTAYENGTKTPPPDMLSKLADIYNVSTDYLLGRTDYKNQTTPNEDEIDEEIKEITSKIKVWYKDEPKDKEVKLRMLRKMVESFEEE